MPVPLSDAADPVIEGENGAPATLEAKAVQVPFKLSADCNVIVISAAAVFRGSVMVNRFEITLVFKPALEFALVGFRP